MKNKTKEEVYIIGEIGQNHNGSVDIAKLIVDLNAVDARLKALEALNIAKRLGDLEAKDIVLQGQIDAIKLEINDRAKIKAIADKTGVDIDAAIKNNHAYDNSDTNVADKPRQRRVQKDAEPRKRRVKATTE